MTTPVPNCFKCLYYFNQRKCKAFPIGIPLKIILGDDLHISHYPGDKGITFHPKNQNQKELIDSQEQ